MAWRRSTIHCSWWHRTAINEKAPPKRGRSRAALPADSTTLSFQRGFFFAQPDNLIAQALATGTETPLTSDGVTAIWTAREWLPAADTDSAESELAATGLLSADSARLLVVGLLSGVVIAAGIAVVGVTTARRRTRA